MQTELNSPHIVTNFEASQLDRETAECGRVGCTSDNQLLSLLMSFHRQQTRALRSFADEGGRKYEAWK